MSIPPHLYEHFRRLINRWMLEGQIRPCRISSSYIPIEVGDDVGWRYCDVSEPRSTEALCRRKPSTAQSQAKQETFLFRRGWWVKHVRVMESEFWKTDFLFRGWARREEALFVESCVSLERRAQYRVGSLPNVEYGEGSLFPR